MRSAWLVLKLGLAILDCARSTPYHGTGCFLKSQDLLLGKRSFVEVLKRGCWVLDLFGWTPCAFLGFQGFPLRLLGRCRLEGPLSTIRCWRSQAACDCWSKRKWDDVLCLAEYEMSRDILIAYSNWLCNRVLQFDRSGQLVCPGTSRSWLINDACGNAPWRDEERGHLQGSNQAG